MNKEEVPSVNPKLDAMCEMLKTIHDLNERNKMLEAQIEKMQEKLKADLIARLEEQMQYSTSPSCTKGMELFIRSIEEWEIKEK